MTLEQYLNQKEPGYKPVVILEPEDYIILNRYKLAGQTGYFILIPAIQADPDFRVSGEFEVLPGEAVLRTITGARSCFYIKPCNHIHT